MAKHRHRRSHRHGVKKGGNYSSASTYGSYVNGSGDSQFARTFDQSGQYANRPGGEYIGAQGQWSQQPSSPSAQNLSLIQSAGKKSRKRRGGFLGEVISQAIVPFGILGLQQTYKRKRQGGRKSRRHRR
jgi:hypothetical protein